MVLRCFREETARRKAGSQRVYGTFAQLFHTATFGFESQNTLRAMSSKRTVVRNVSFMARRLQSRLSRKRFAGSTVPFALTAGTIPCPDGSELSAAQTFRPRARVRGLTRRRRSCLSGGSGAGRKRLLRAVSSVFWLPGSGNRWRLARPQIFAKTFRSLRGSRLVGGGPRRPAQPAGPPPALARPPPRRRPRSARRSDRAPPPPPLLLSFFRNLIFSHHADRVFEHPRNVRPSLVEVATTRVLVPSAGVR